MAQLVLCRRRFQLRWTFEKGILVYEDYEVLFSYFSTVMSVGNGNIAFLIAKHMTALLEGSLKEQEIKQSNLKVSQTWNRRRNNLENTKMNDKKKLFLCSQHLSQFQRLTSSFEFGRLYLRPIWLIHTLSFNHYRGFTYDFTYSKRGLKILVSTIQIRPRLKYKFPVMSHEKQSFRSNVAQTLYDDPADQ